MPPTTVCSARASLKKIPGVLELTESHIKWRPETQDPAKKTGLRIPFDDMGSTMLCSKPNSPQVKLKIIPDGNEAGLTFIFLAEHSVAVEERETFQKILLDVVQRNRDRKLRASVPGTPSSKAPVASRAASISSERGTPTIVGTDPAADFRLRKKVLMANPELAALHQDLVMSGQITESEFWDGREHLLLAQQSEEVQRKGRYGPPVDLRGKTDEDGKINVTITQQLITSVFEEFPIMAEAYNEHVPKNMSEEQFWKRYLDSKLFHQHQASIRSSAKQHKVRDDPVFDQYLLKDDDDVEPRKPPEVQPEKFLDLGATTVDHGETTIEPNITMQAGRQKGAIPLIRKFNEHSERQLNAALGTLPPHKRRRIAQDDPFAEIELDDLRGHDASGEIVLEMQDRQRYFEGRMREDTEMEDVPEKLDPVATRKEARSALKEWQRDLGNLKLSRQSSDTALLHMTQNVHARQEVRSKKNDIPEGLFRQMTTCQTAASEFLRQYWSSILPPPADHLPVATLAQATPAQRATKAAKMVGYLARTHEKVAALVASAGQYSVDGARVENAMKPTLDAVNHALAFHRSREATAATRRPR